MPPMGRFGQRLLPYLYLVAAVGRLIAAALRLGGLLVQAVAHGIARAAAVPIRSLIGHAVLRGTVLRFIGAFAVFRHVLSPLFKVAY